MDDLHEKVSWGSMQGLDHASYKTLMASCRNQLAGFDHDAQVRRRVAPQGWYSGYRRSSLLYAVSRPSLIFRRRSCKSTSTGDISAGWNRAVDTQNTSMHSRKRECQSPASKIDPGRGVARNFQKDLVRNAHFPVRGKECVQSRRVL